MRATEEFEALRRRLFGIAYRMTGSVGDAEDACQDAWLRWQRVDRATVDNPEAYLVRVVTRLALDRLRSAQRRRETYVGPYLPEPLVADDAATQPRWRPSWPTRSRWRSSCCSTSSRRRSARCCCSTTCSGTRSTRSRRWSTCHPPRAVSWRAARATSSTTSARRCGVPTRRASSELVGNLLATIASGDIEAVMELLAPDVVLLSDGGAQRHAARRRSSAPTASRASVVNLAKRSLATRDVRMVQVNGETGLLFLDDGRPDFTLSFSFTPDGRVRRFYSQLNPEKLRHLR